MAESITALTTVGRHLRKVVLSGDSAGVVRQHRLWFRWFVPRRAVEYHRAPGPILALGERRTGPVGIVRDQRGSVALHDLSTGEVMRRPGHSCPAHNGTHEVGVIAEGSAFLAFTDDVIELDVGRRASKRMSGTRPRVDADTNILDASVVTYCGQTLMARVTNWHANYHVKVNDLQTGRELQGRSETEEDFRVIVLAPTAAGVVAAVAGRAGGRPGITRWDPHVDGGPGTLDSTIPVPARVTAMICSTISGQPRLVVGDEEGYVALYDPVSGACLKRQKAVGARVTAVCGVRTAWRECIVVGAGDGTVEVVTVGNAWIRPLWQYVRALVGDIRDGLLRHSVILVSGVLVTLIGVWTGRAGQALSWVLDQWRD